MMVFTIDNSYKTHIRIFISFSVYIKSTAINISYILKLLSIFINYCKDNHVFSQKCRSRYTKYISVTKYICIQNIFSCFYPAFLTSISSTKKRTPPCGREKRTAASKRIVLAAARLRRDVTKVGCIMGRRKRSAAFSVLGFGNEYAWTASDRMENIIINTFKNKNYILKNRKINFNFCFQK